MAGLVFLAGAAALLWFLVLAPGEASGSTPADAGDAVAVEVGQFLTNLSGEGSRRLLRLNLVLSVTDRRAAKELGEKANLVKSEVLALLRSKQLAEVEGGEGMQQLGLEIVARINLFLGREAVLRAYFTDFIIQ
jgi:flagellar basal body-associated protein FliL